MSQEEGAPPETPPAGAIRSVEERNALVLANMPMVDWVIRENPNFGRGEDMRQAGFLGLVKAAKYWDPEKGRFSTYAFWCILGHLIAQKRTESILHIPKSVRGQEWLRVYQSIIFDQSDSDAWAGANPYDDRELLELRMDLEAMLAALKDERQAYVLRRRYLDGKTLEQVGAELGVCKERVRQIVESATGAIRRRWVQFANAIHPGA